MNSFISVLIISLILSFSYSDLKSQTFQSGDVFVATVYNSPAPGVNWFSPDGTFISNINTYPFFPYTYSLAFDKSGYLYVGVNWFGSSIAKIDSLGNYTGDFIGGLSRPNQIVFDSSGNVYIGFNIDGSTGGIQKFDSGGNFIQHYTPGNLGTVFGIDLDKDQCTMYYVDGNSTVVKRWDVCTNTALPDFITEPLPGIVGRVKLRNNGEVFLSLPNSPGGKILRLSSSGRILQSYLTEWSHAISFDPDQTSFWVVNAYTNEVVKYDIGTGTVLTSFTSTSGASSFGLIVKDEILAATSNLPTLPDSTILTLQPTDTLYQTNETLYFLIPVRDNENVPCRFCNLTVDRSGANAAFADIITTEVTTDANGDAYYSYTGTIPGVDTIVATLEANNFRDTILITWDAILPVELSSFTSSINKNNVTLNWITTSEQNNSGFDIERSFARGGVKGQTSDSWIKIGTVNGNGNSNEPKPYSFTDRGLNSGKYYYRLKQIDFNGNFEYFNLSESIGIENPLHYSLSQNYPNPFNPSTKINFEIPEESFVSLKVYDLSGKEIAKIINETKQAGYYTVDFNASSANGGLSSGIYFYKLSSSVGTGIFTKTMKMVILK